MDYCARIFFWQKLDHLRSRVSFVISAQIINKYTNNRCGVVNRQKLCLTVSVRDMSLYEYSGLGVVLKCPEIGVRS